LNFEFLHYIQKGVNTCLESSRSKRKANSRVRLLFTVGFIFDEILFIKKNNSTFAAQFLGRFEILNRNN